MKNAMKSVILVSLFAISVTAIAQQGQGGRGQGRGQGGGMMMGQRGGMGGPASLINRTDVQADLKLTDAMKAELTKHQEKQREDQRSMFENMRNSGGGGIDAQAIQKLIQENQAKNETAIKGIIGEDKWKRLSEIHVQLQGNRAILDAKVQEALGFDDAQKAAVRALQAKQMEAAQSLMEKMRNQEIDREQMQEITRKNSETMDAELSKILKGDQPDKLKAMGGAPFKATEQPRGGRGGGGGGR